MRQFFLIILSCLFLAPLSVSAQTKTKKTNHNIDLFEGEKGSDSPVLIEGGVETEAGFAVVSGRPGFQLKFQRGGNGIFVPAVVNGKKVYFLFDTGATTTTLNVKLAKSARVLPEKDAPTAMLSTANGTIETQYGIIDNLKLGGRNHFNVSYALCAACPSGTFKGRPVAGLLGMNVIGRYRASIDDEEGVVDLMPLKSGDNRVRDIRIFLQVVPVGGMQGKKDVKINVMVRNHGKIAVKKVKIKLQCQGDKSETKTIGKLKGRSKKNLTISVPTANCGLPRVEVISGQWAL